LSITFRRGNLTIDDYLGRVSRQNVKLPPPPADTATEFNDAVNRSLALSRKRLEQNRKSVDAQYELGAAVGLRASYMATVDGSMLGAFRAAHEAYDAHEEVLKLNPSRRDAGLIVGTYRYLVAALALPLRVVAYMTGFGGGKEKGLQLIEGAADYRGENQTDAQVALVLLYNRERRYDDALKVLAGLRAAYPRNRLFWLEAGATSLRAGRASDAEQFFNEGITRFSSDERARMFGEEGLWFYKRGAARAAMGRTGDAEGDLKKSLASEARDWVHGRAHLELAKLALKAGNRPAANADLRVAITLCDGDNDGLTADEARQLLK
jgi:tetratricopeptide (TPR) repeat protein